MLVHRIILRRILWETCQDPLRVYKLKTRVFMSILLKMLFIKITDRDEVFMTFFTPLVFLFLLYKKIKISNFIKISKTDGWLWYFALFSFFLFCIKEQNQISNFVRNSIENWRQKWIALWSFSCFFFFFSLFQGKNCIYRDREKD